jgi:gamma-glutamyltranspeptidase/glutathione hydrolase
MKSTRAFRHKPTESTTFYPRVFGRNGAIATHHYLSAMAGIDMLKDGGTAVDAAVAACFVEGVVNPQMHTIGGEIPMLIWQPGMAKPDCINGNMVAPERATPKAFKDLGYDKIPPKGVLAAGVPGAFGALIEALDRYGRLSFTDVIAPALELARYGFPVHSGLLRQHKFGIADNAEHFRAEWHGTRDVYLANDELPVEGQVIRNTDLADTYDFLSRAEAGKTGDRAVKLRAVFDAFYKGDVAAAIVDFVKRNGGFLQRSDFDRFRIRTEAPVKIAFGGADIFKCGPWTQGPAMLQALSILKNFDLLALGHNSTEYVHVVVEALKLAFADREQFYADPDHVEVPIDVLLSDGYGKTRSKLIADAADLSIRPGDPKRGNALLPNEDRFGGSSWGPGTVHVNAMDNQGVTAAFTPSGAWLMSSEVIPAVGFPLGSRLSNCHLEPLNHPNIVAPFKQPRTTISPTIAMRGGEGWLSFGSMGGDQQDQWQLQFLLNRLVFDMNLQASIEAPKFSSEHFPGFFHPQDHFLNQLRIEETLGDSVLDGLRQCGHDLDIGPAWSEGFLGATERNLQSGVLESGVDPRGNKSEVFSALALAY